MKPLQRCLLLLILTSVLVSCASGPKYGAARKTKKSCDCPHWNAVDRTGEEVHAGVPHGHGN